MEMGRKRREDEIIEGKLINNGKGKQLIEGREKIYCQSRSIHNGTCIQPGLG